MRTAGALLALAAVSIFLAVPAVAPSCAQVTSNPCCAAGVAECAGMASVGLCCAPSPSSHDDQGRLAQVTASERPSRPQEWVDTPASATLTEAGMPDASLAGHGPRARESLIAVPFSVLRI